MVFLKIPHFNFNNSTSFPWYSQIYECERVAPPLSPPKPSDTTHLTNLCLLSILLATVRYTVESGNIGVIQVDVLKPETDSIYI